MKILNLKPVKSCLTDLRTVKICVAFIQHAKKITEEERCLSKQVNVDKTDFLRRKSVTCIYIIIIGIQPLGRSGQRPEFSQATGMALVRCILGKFLGAACHCFLPRIYIEGSK